MDTTCSICLEGVTLTSKYTFSCEHMIHTHCMKNYSKTKSPGLVYCPVCDRLDLNYISNKIKEKLNSGYIEEILDGCGVSDDLLKDVSKEIIETYYHILTNKVADFMNRESIDDIIYETAYIHGEMSEGESDIEDLELQLRNERIMDLNDMIEYASI